MRAITLYLSWATLWIVPRMSQALSRELPSELDFDSGLEHPNSLPYAAATRRLIASSFPRHRDLSTRCLL